MTPEIGHGLGLILVLRLALDHPERVQNLTLFEPVLSCASTGPGRKAHDTAIADIQGARTSNA